MAYEWSFGDGGLGSSEKITHVYTDPGEYTARLQVSLSDGSYLKARTRISVVAANQPPVARAGADQAVTTGDTVTLDGSASEDPEGNALIYAWTLEAPEGSAASLSNAAAVAPTFTADVTGVYTAALVVNDGDRNSKPDTVVVAAAPGQTQNRPPMADAGPLQRVRVGTQVMLDGGGSYDPEGLALTYAWVFDQVPLGSQAVLDNADSAAPSFTPDIVGAYFVSLVVRDGEQESEPDTAEVYASDEGPVNQAPVADAGFDQTVYAGANVALDGSRSKDGDGDALTYSWSLAHKPAGSAANLDNADTPTPTFVADVPGEYLVQLVVNDGADPSEPDTARITALASGAPVLSIDPLTYSIDAGGQLQIPVSAADPDGDFVTLGAGPSLDNAAFPVMNGPSASGEFSFSPKPEQRGTHTVTFTARDATGRTSAASVLITVTQPNRPPVLAQPDDAAVDEGRNLTVKLAAEDPDGDAVVYAAEPLPENAVFVAATGTLTFAPDYEQAGEYSLTCAASDGELSSEPQTLTIAVNDVQPGDPGAPKTVKLEVVSPASPELQGTSEIRGTVNTSDDPPPPAGLRTALITSLVPSEVSQGTVLDVGVAGYAAEPWATHFAAGQTVADFGAGIAVESVAVNGPADAVVSISVAPDAEPGIRSVVLRTASETAVSTVAFAVKAGQAVVTGRVLGPDTGEPLAGVMLSIEGTVLSTQTDAQGRYTFADAPAGPVTLVVNAPGRELVRIAGNAAPGETADLGDTQPRAIVFDPNAPPAATALSVLGRGGASKTGLDDLEAAKALIEDAMLAVGGPEAGVLDAYGNQRNSAFEGAGTLSLTPETRDDLALRLTSGESISLQELLHSLSFGLFWDPEPLQLDAWMAGLQEQADAAWRDPSAPGNALAVLCFNQGRTILSEAPRLSPRTRLNPLQAMLFTTSFLGHAATPTEDAVPGAKNAKADVREPYVRIAAPSVVAVGDEVVLDGSASRVYSGNSPGFKWLVYGKPFGSGASISPANQVIARFTADIEGAYEIAMTVDDGVNSPATAHTVVYATDEAPRADAGPDQRVDPGALVELDGGGSYDPAGKALDFEWGFYSTPGSTGARLSNADRVNPSFQPTVEGEYKLQLTVRTDTHDSVPDFVTVVVGNRPPVADAGRDKVVTVDQTYTLSALGSEDPDGDAIEAYQWQVVSRPESSSATPAVANLPETQITIDQEGDYIIQLTVWDAAAQSEPAQVKLTTKGVTPFTGYWRNFFTGKEANAKLAFSHAYAAKMETLRAQSYMGASLFVDESPAAAAGGYGLANGIAMEGFLGDSIDRLMLEQQALIRIPHPPTIKSALVEEDELGKKTLVVKAGKSPTDTGKGFPRDRFLYTLWRFDGQSGLRDEVKTEEFFPVRRGSTYDDVEFHVSGEELKQGTHLYAVNVTRFTERAKARASNPQDYPVRDSWWPITMQNDVDLSVFRLGVDRLTSDYSESKTVYIGPADFKGSSGGIEPVGNLAGYESSVYISDAETGVFYTWNVQAGTPWKAFAPAGFKRIERDGAYVVQEGLAVDATGNIYALNAASDASFGGRVFRWNFETASRNFVGLSNYYSTHLGFANPTFSGPSVVRPGNHAIEAGGALYKDNLVLADNLALELKQIPVNASFDANRRVGKRLAKLPPGGFGRVIDLEYSPNTPDPFVYDDHEYLYVLDGRRVLELVDGEFVAGSEVYLEFAAAGNNKDAN